MATYLNATKNFQSSVHYAKVQYDMDKTSGLYCTDENDVPLTRYYVSCDEVAQMYPFYRAASSQDIRATFPKWTHDTIYYVSPSGLLAEVTKLG